MAPTVAPSSSYVISLPRQGLPLDYLTQLQRRLGQLLISIGELQTHVYESASLDDWPGLLSRHLTLLSQTHTLTTALLSPHPTSQTPSLVALLIREAQLSNLYADPSSTDTSLISLGPLPQPGATPSNPLDIGAASSSAAVSSSSSTIRQRRPDPSSTSGTASSNTTATTTTTSTGRQYAPHPFVPVDAEKATTLVPALLLAKSAPVVDDLVQARLITFLNGSSNGIESDSANGDASAVAGTAAQWRRRMERARYKTAKHDGFAGQMTRLWIHCREAPDEYGEKYDWGMRLSLQESDDEEGEEDEGGESKVEEVDDDDDEAMEEVVGDQLGERNESATTKKRKRDGEETKIGDPLSVDEVLSFLRTGARA